MGCVMGIVRQQTNPTEEQNRAIRRLAEAAGSSAADILRRAVEAHRVAQGTGEDADAHLALVNPGTGDTGDDSVRHNWIDERPQVYVLRFRRVHRAGRPR